MAFRPTAVHAVRLRESGSNGKISMSRRERDRLREWGRAAWRLRGEPCRGEGHQGACHIKGLASMLRDPGYIELFPSFP